MCPLPPLKLSPSLKESGKSKIYLHKLVKRNETMLIWTAYLGTRNANAGFTKWPITIKFAHMLLRMSLIKRNKSCKTKVKETYEVKTLRTFYLWSIKVPPASLTKWWLSDYYQRNLHCISLKCLIYKFIKTDLKKNLNTCSTFIHKLYIQRHEYANICKFHTCFPTNRKILLHYHGF